MKIIKNEKTINRNARIGQILSIVAMVTLGLGLYITFSNPEQITLSIMALMVGFLLSQIGIYFTNRWGEIYC